MDDERKEEKPKIESKRKEMSSFVARKNEKRKCRVKNDWEGNCRTSRA